MDFSTYIAIAFCLGLIVGFIFACMLASTRIKNQDVEISALWKFIEIVGLDPADPKFKPETERHIVDSLKLVDPRGQNLDTRL